MFSAPQKLKFKKFHKLKFNTRRTENRFFCPKFGDYGLQAIGFGKVTAAQLESGRLVIRRFSKKQAFLRISVFPHAAVSKKPTSARMGKGKGAPEYWVAVVKPGRILFEADGVPMTIAKEALRLAAQKLPVTTRFIVRRDYDGQ